MHHSILIIYQLSIMMHHTPHYPYLLIQEPPLMMQNPILIIHYLIIHHTPHYPYLLIQQLPLMMQNSLLVMNPPPIQQPPLMMQHSLLVMNPPPIMSHPGMIHHHTPLGIDHPILLIHQPPHPYLLIEKSSLLIHRPHRMIQ